MQRQKWKGRRRRRSGRADTNYVARPTPRAAYASPRHWRGDGTLLAGIAGITQCRVYLRCVTRPWKMYVRHADERRRLTQQRQVSHPCSSSLGHDHPSNHQLLRPHSPHTTNFLLPTHQPRGGSREPVQLDRCGHPPPDSVSTTTGRMCDFGDDRQSAAYSTRSLANSR